MWPADRNKVSKLKQQRQHTAHSSSDVAVAGMKEHGSQVHELSPCACGTQTSSVGFHFTITVIIYYKATPLSTKDIFKSTG